MPFIMYPVVMDYPRYARHSAAKPKIRWLCPVCDHLNSHRKTVCARPECPGRKSTDA